MAELKSISQKLQVIIEKIADMDTRMSSMEEKMKKKIKIKAKGSRDINNVHIFPFDESDEFVKIAIIDEEKKASETYPVVELLNMDFKKLANLMIHSDILSVQWTEFTPSTSTAKYEKNQYVLCN
jgi:hypothetical protein